MCFVEPRQEPITLGDTPGVFLSFFANHVGGSGSAAHLLVITCKDDVIEVVLSIPAELQALRERVRQIGGPDAWTAK